jgi:hypothetical protein
MPASGTPSWFTSGKVVWKSRMTAVSLGCFGCWAVHSPHLSLAQVWVPGPQTVEQSRTTGATSHRLASWLFWHNRVPSPQLSLHGSRTGATSHRAASWSFWHRRVPSPQLSLHGSRTGAT